MFGIVSYRELEHYDSIRPISNKGNWFLILLGNLHNPTPALERVLKNYEYLNDRTKDVRFFMPGFVVDQEGIKEKSTRSFLIRRSLQDSFEFRVDGFLDTIDWLENGLEEYEYSEDMELILLPFSREDNNEIVYNFENLLCYNLDNMLKEGKNIIRFITKAVQVIYQDMSPKETTTQMEGVRNELYLEGIHKVFIAGSKKLNRERDSIRAVFSQLSNRGRVRYDAYTFEDFERSFTIKGRQDDYDNFIREEADSVLFVLNDTIGGITQDEFKIALESYIYNNRPQIYVYSRNTFGDELNSEIQEIKRIINEKGQYYTDYTDIQDLKNQIIRDFQ